MFLEDLNNNWFLMTRAIIKTINDKLKNISLVEH